MRIGLHRSGLSRQFSRLRRRLLELYWHTIRRHTVYALENADENRAVLYCTCGGLIIVWRDHEVPREIHLATIEYATCKAGEALIKLLRMRRGESPLPIAKLIP